MGNDTVLNANGSSASSAPLLNNSYGGASAPPSYFQAPDYVTSSRFNDVPAELIEDVRAIRKELAALGIKETHEARVCLALDISRSMQNPNQFFHNTQFNTPGPIYDLLNKAISTALVIDDNQTLEIFPFGSDARVTPYKATKDNYKTVIDEEIFQNDPARTMQSNTNYAAAMRAVRQYYFGRDATDNPKSADPTPVFMIFVTDGAPNMEQRQALAQFRASSYQPIFCKIVALKGLTNPDFAFLQNEVDDAPTLDQRKGRPPEQCNYIDNGDFVPLNNPAELTTSLLFREYPQWLVQAQENRHGHTLLTQDQGLELSVVKKLQKDADRVGESSKSCCTIV